MPKEIPSWMKLLLSSVWCGLVILFATDRGNYETAFISQFFCYALFTSVVIYLRLRRSFADAALIAVLAACIAVVEHFVLKLPLSAPALISWFGCAGFILLGVRTICAQDRRLLLAGWMAASLFAASDWLASDFLRWTAMLHPKTLDLYLLSFDGSLGAQPSFLMGALFQRWHWLSSISLFFYVALPLSLALVYVNQLLRNRRFALPMLIAFVAAGPIGIVFYNLFPATGPIHVLTSQFPLHAPPSEDLMHLLLEPIRVDAPRNAIPSLHMAWVLLAWWWSRELDWGSRAIAMAFVVFTVLATLGTGEHYLVDLVVALPCALLLQAAVTVKERAGIATKVGPALLGGVGVLLWFALLRFAPALFWSSPAVPWLLITVTVFVCLTAERRYCRMATESEQSSVSSGVISATAD